MTSVPRDTVVWMRVGVGGVLAVHMILVCAGAAAAQTPESQTRAAATEATQVDKAGRLHPQQPGKVEMYLNQAERMLADGPRLHPFFQSAYAGGGFTLGAGYRAPVSAYNSIDIRGSFTFSAYKRIE